MFLRLNFTSCAEVVVSQQPDDPRYRDLQPERVDPIVLIGFELLIERA